MVCVSADTAPNCCSSSARVSAISSSGTAWPSLNRSGRRISKRRNVLLIGSRTVDDERDAFDRQVGQGGFGNDHLPTRPTLEGEAAGQVTESPSLRAGISEADANHVLILRRTATCGKH